ncbi:unnamed protein product [Sphagnum troendelagicum]|uniref:Uncharacterized protein n=1 Tax=Sphagnum troendelagicum TaxID=128251 RepID=A0ABP0TSL9_9BRYO
MMEEIEEWMVSTPVQGQGIEEKNRSMKSNTFFLEIRRRQKRELTYWRSSTADMCFGLWIFQEAYSCGINIHAQKV